MCDTEPLSLVAAGFGTLHFKQVAGLHRAVPSTTLDKACMQFAFILHTFFKMSTPVLQVSSGSVCIVHNSFIDFSARKWYDMDKYFRS